MKLREDMCLKAEYNELFETEMEREDLWTWKWWDEWEISIDMYTVPCVKQLVENYYIAQELSSLAL